MNENMKCAICQDTMTEPVTALCGAHNFCHACLAAHIGSCYTTPTCPTCRAPIQTSVGQLHVNCMLRDMIAASLPSPSALPSALPPAPAPIRISTNHVGGKLHVKLVAPSGPQSMSLNLIALLDNSGSMGMSSVEDQSAEASQLSRSDIVGHAYRTCVELLRPEDELALVLFDDKAEVVMRPTRLTDAGRRTARTHAARIRPTGGTAIWRGLEAALGLAAPGKNNVIILQTDGESDPSLDPRIGIIAAFRQWQDTHRDVQVSLHTVGFGFGAKLDMALLRELAHLGGGTACYVPDGSMVGTVFIHLLANLMSCQYSGVRLQIDSLGVNVPVGFLQADSERNFVFDLPGGADAEIAVTCFPPVSPEVVAPTGMSSWPLAQSRAVAELRTALDNAPKRIAKGLQPYDTEPLVAALRSLDADPRIDALISDLDAPGKYDGQVGKALVDATNFTRWGGHYVTGVLCGLVNEWPINFKDALPKVLGSALTQAHIQRGDDIFTGLPPPTASCRSYGAPAAPVSMAAVHNAFGGCFLGSSRVHMSDGTEKRCDEIQPGDVDICGYVIAKVIKMYVPYADIVRLTGAFRPSGASSATEGGFTPWHPVYPSETGAYPTNKEHGWVHPVSLGPIERVQVDAVYNFVLSRPGQSERPGVLIVDGMMACTMGHSMVAPIIEHAYFGKKVPGKRNVIEDLEEQEGWDAGYVVLPETARFVSDPDTGIICGLKAE